MDTGQFTVFISSRMEELAAERSAVEQTLERLDVEAFVFEHDVGADPDSIEQVYLRQIEAADLYVGLFWRGYGAHTAREYEHARALGKPILLYEKRTELDRREDALAVFLQRIQDTAAGHTAAWFETPEALAALVQRDLEQWLDALRADVLSRLDAAALARHRPLLTLAEKVRRTWIRDYLEPLLAEVARLDLPKETVPEAIEHPAERAAGPVLAREELPEGVALAKMLFEEGPRLLLLGAPGAGKTVALLRLARMLGNRLLKAPRRPVPIVLSLAGWTPEVPDLAGWLAAEMEAQYHERPEHTRTWLAERRLLLLLDALDEVPAPHRGACVAAINAFVQQHDPPGLVVCSRTDEYEALTKEGTRLRFERAVRLLPLSPAQVEVHLARQGARLAALRGVLQEDAGLYEMATSPLMLFVMTTAFQGRGEEAEAMARLEAPAARRRYLFARYVDRAVERVPRSRRRYARARVEALLVWLARRLREHPEQQGLFLLERMQPSWLEGAADRWGYALASRLGGGLVLGLPVGVLAGVMLAGETRGGFGLGLKGGLVVGLLAGLLTGLFDALRLPRTGAGAGRLAGALVPALGLGAAVAVLVWLLADARGLPMLIALSLPFALFFGLKGRGKTLRSDIRTVERLHVSGAAARRGGLYGLAAGGVLSALLGLGLAYAGPGFSGAEGLVFGVPGAVLGGLLGAFTGGLRAQERTAPTPPLDGLRIAARNVALGAAAGAAAGAVLGGLTAFAVAGAGAALRWGGAAALAGGLGAALWYGGLDLLQHTVLRGLLAMRRHLPLRARSLLGYAARLTLLRKAGGGYVFLHRALREFFADGAAEAPGAPPVRPAQPRHSVEPSPARP
ncbi:MAG: DUF4062 domain-containing protein [Rhodothermales bacterium]|nr:DUF4062 domain-containing protein [Rhodothermales bacterium]